MYPHPESQFIDYICQIDGPHLDKHGMTA